MHDPDERPRFRWRIVLWGLALLFLVPVLYVAAAGPATWWSRHHFHGPEWMDIHARSLKPLYQHPQTRAALDQYMRWWFNRPAPRSWRRQYLVDQLAHRRKIVDDLHAIRARFDAEADALRARLDALEAQPSSPQELPLEAIGIRLRIEELARARGRVGSPLAPFEMRNLPNHEVNALQAEEQLERFDAR